MGIVVKHTISLSHILILVTVLIVTQINATINEEQSSSGVSTVEISTTIAESKSTSKNVPLKKTNSESSSVSHQSKKIPPSNLPSTSTPTLTPTAEPVLVPDDEDLIDDNHWEKTKLPSDPSAVSTVASGSSILPLVRTLSMILFAFIMCTILVWNCGGGHEINQMMLTKSKKMKSM